MKSLAELDHLIAEFEREAAECEVDKEAFMFEDAAEVLKGERELVVAEVESC